MKVTSIFCLFFTVFLFFSCKKNIEDKFFGEITNLKHQGKWFVMQTETQTKITWDGINRNKISSFINKDLPVKKVIVCNSSAIPFITALGKQNTIIGIRGKETIFNQFLLNNIKQNKIKDLGTKSSKEIESIINLKPDVVIVNASSEDYEKYQPLKRFKIQVLYFNDYEEVNPLARSEYIKIFGILFDEEKKANKIFTEIENSYNATKMKVKNELKPSVFVNNMYGDVWFMPGKETLTANFINDAGGNYLWNSDRKISYALSYEAVLEKAEKADFWLNVSDFEFIKDLQSNDKRYTWFDAFKNKKLFNVAAKRDELGNNDFFEMGVLRADIVLKDIASILHPNLFPEHQLYFYQALK